MNDTTKIAPFENCPPLDGYHCQTNSLAKIYRHAGCPLSEEMLLGLGAGMSFMYWHQKNSPPFIGGRGNTKDFFQDIGKRTGVKLELQTTTSSKKAEAELVARLKQEKPVMVFADMGLLPWFDMPEDYHFGGHTFIVCGYDGGDTVLASDMDQRAAGLKKGFTYPITLERLREARNSPHKPFPPKNAYLDCGFSGFHKPDAKDISSSILQATESMLRPPISNFGIPGIRRTAKEIRKWPARFDEGELRLNLFSIYIFTEIGGTGGGCFRYMYARFLEEAAEIMSGEAAGSGNSADAAEALKTAASRIHTSGKMFTRLGNSFKDVEPAIDIESAAGVGKLVEDAAALYEEIAGVEEEAFRILESSVLNS
jgi:hypothetical protein